MRDPLVPTSGEPFPSALELGTEIVTAGVTVTEAHVVAWSGLTGDWVALHNNAVEAAETEFGERIAHGPLTLSLALGLVTQQRVFDRIVIAWLGLDQVRAQAPVRFGDTIRVVARVSEYRRSRKPGRAVCSLDHEVLNSSGVRVMTFVNTVLLKAPEPDDGRQG